MYGYRQSKDNGLMTNLNSISSSLSSIDTIGRRPNTKASVDNLITLRSHSIASTSLLWKSDKEDKTYATRDGTRYKGSDIYHSGSRSITSYCFGAKAALNFLLVPLLLLTITRQVFDFLGQIWLQILVNFFTIIIIIVALFGTRQRRIAYLSLYSLWALFNTAWNLIVICVHSKIKDVGITEDTFSFYIGATSWWHANGPGCLPYNISSIQPPVSILQPNIITGCRLDYHLIESSQAAIHALLSIITSFISCCVISNFRRYPAFYKRNSLNNEKSYKLNNLNGERSRVNQDPYPSHHSSRFNNTNSASLKRAANKTSSRSSQHSVSSMRSTRRRNRQSTDGTLPTPRGSTSSMQRSQKYGSISSRRSSRTKERRGDISSLTYGQTGDRRAPSQRTRLSSLSSVDYLPSYQPPHSSNANLLSSYGEISSVDSYNNQNGSRGSKNRQTSIKTTSRGNTNPTYNGSRSSICSHNTNINNYDDLSYIYGNNKSGENHYGASSSNVGDTSRQRQQIYQTNKSNSIRRNGLWQGDQTEKIQAETYLPISELSRIGNAGDGSTMTKMPDGSFQSFSSKHQATSEKSLMNGKPHLTEINNNSIDQKSLANNFIPTSFESRSQTANGFTNQQIYTNQRNSRQPIYTNQVPNSETPI